MYKVLVLGGSGLAGRSIINEMEKHNQFQVYATYFKNPISLTQDRSFKLNIKDLDGLDRILKSVGPQYIVSCLRGDFNKQLILHIELAKYLRKNGGKLYFFSTTNVFDNDNSKPHYEDDLPDSCTEYGKYKVECENKMTEILNDDVCILRLPQIWGKDCPRMHKLLYSLRNDKNVTIYPKLFVNTNTNVMIAKQLCYIIENNLKGIFHLASEDAINYKEFYDELINGLGFDNAKIEEDFEEQGYFVLLSKRTDEFPEHLRITNKSVINYLINNKA